MKEGKENKKYWIHPNVYGLFLPQDDKGFLLFSSERMYRFSSKSEAMERGWAEMKEKRKRTTQWSNEE